MALATKTGEVKFVRKGRPGAMPYPVGEHDNNTLYTCTESLAPMVYQDGQYYVMSKVGTWRSSSMGRTPKEDYARYGSNAMWLLMEKQKALITEMFFTEFAKLGSAVFHGDFMFSQWGKDQSGNITKAYQNFEPSKLEKTGCPFTPNVYIDWLNGNARICGTMVINHLYTPWTLIPLNGKKSWDPNQHSSNISVNGYPGYQSILVLPDPKKYAGIELHLACFYWGCAIQSPNKRFQSQNNAGYYYKLPLNTITTVSAMEHDLGLYMWVIHNPIEANLSDSYSNS